MKNTSMEQALITFIENNQEKFYRITFSYTKNRDDALDVIHDAIIRALKKQHTLKEPQYLETWFFRILINECLGLLRKRKKISYIEDSDTLPTFLQSKSEHTDYIDLYDALDRLSPDLKTVVILRFFEDMKFEDIAQITSTNINTIKSRLYKALKLLKIDMEGFEND